MPSSGRRCACCLTVAPREAWDDPASAQSDPKLGERRRWCQFRRARWECQACGWSEYTVEPHDLRRGPPAKRERPSMRMPKVGLEHPPGYWPPVMAMVPHWCQQPTFSRD
jgi:hypothetical protein